MECPICIRNYTNKHRLKITCSTCNQDVCSKCMVKYIMSTILNPKCMYCEAPVYLCLYRDKFSTKEYKKIIMLNFEIRFQIEQTNLNKSHDNQELVKDFISKSVNCEKCNNVLIKNQNETLICIPCNVLYCNMCFSNLNNVDGHMCSENNYFNKLKPCPNCYSIIEKDEAGCDQMFCVLCHTGFSWETGLIIEDVYLHNPHYYSLKKNTGELVRNELDDPREGRFYIKCETEFRGQKIKLKQIYKKLGIPPELETDKCDFLLTFHRMFLNVLFELNRLLNMETKIRYNLNINYIYNLISFSVWKLYLKRHFYLMKQYEAVKYNILKIFDKLYYLVLNNNVYNESELEELCLQAAHQTDYILTH